MGQHLPDRLFWARDERDGGASEAAESAAKDTPDLVRRPDARGTH
jgi:hypothetical protein